MSGINKCDETSMCVNGISSIENGDLGRQQSG